jgi:creatinine amidohydrolase/Fe(II)-dependent formamide hydrolase-like protein
MIACLADLTWPEVAERLRAKPVVLVPCGAIGQHGPHLPLEVDALLATDIALGVAERAQGLVAPALSYRYCSMPKSGRGPCFGITLNLQGDTLAHPHRERVHVERIPENPPANFPPYDMFPAARDWVPSSGALTSVKAATADKGQLLYEPYVEAIAQAGESEFGHGAE